MAPVAIPHGIDSSPQPDPPLPRHLMHTEPTAESRTVSASTDPPHSVSVPRGVLFREVGGEAVVLELESGRYYGLDPVGTRMWTLLAEEGRLDTVHRRLLGEYEVGADRLRRDLETFVHDLVGRGLLTADPA